ncbi:hypothetical protein EJ06DRAFT_579167 [Trichodelitschia bisporula]|uniref:Sucrose transport protein n=1 Tax=Trichodelitschia bisporula TaxID=703511 RepID=A0A6G1I953_9PEZI|nr:hypothetical protein EJ06DRAFT_579167 [Trichodelitschia bisporula]
MPSIATWAGTASIKGSSESTRMALLTLSLIGIQFTWGIEMTYCTPYLLKLGLTKSKVSLVWIAGPISGLIMQPIVGVIADRSTSPWGRRRPFMVVGTVIVSICLLILGWTSEIVGVFVSDPDMKRSATIALAVLSIYGVDFAINAVQASTRSLVVDTLPIPKQQLGSAWASRMVSIGGLIGYAAGAMDLSQIFGTSIGDSQFKQLTVVAAVTICATVGTTCWAVSERVLVSSGRGQDESIGAMATFSQIMTTALHLPDRIAAICWIQFWCWIGWFPFLFYSTTWIGEVYLRYNAPADARDHADSLGQIGRVGSLSLIVFSLVTFAGSVMLPWVIETPTEETPDFTPRPPASIAPFLAELQKYKPRLITAWSYSHIIFAGSMVSAPFVTSLRSATTIIAMCGIPWALACWAPFTFMGMEINRLNSGTDQNRTRKSRGSMEMNSTQSAALLSHPDNESKDSSSDLAGVYLGILNLYTTLPQFIGTFISWMVFSILEPGKSPELAKEAHPDEHHSKDGPNAIAVCLFIGAVAALVAAYATNRLDRISR